MSTQRWEERFGQHRFGLFWIFHEIPATFFGVTPFISMDFTLFRQILPRGYA